MSLHEEFPITKASFEDLDALAALEALGFPADEAASKEVFAYRLKNFPDWFLTARAQDKIIGLVNGILSKKETITDDDYLPEGEHQSDGKNLLIFGLVVHPDYRRRGIAETLLKTIMEKAKRSGIKRVALTCRDVLIPYYQKFGFKNLGVSASVLGNVTWYDMVIDL